MDRHASNTLRTLAIVAISIVVIIGSLGLLLLALCFGMLGNLGGSGHHDPQVINFVIAALVAAALLIAFGVFGVAKLAKGIIRESPVPPLRWNVPDDPHSHAPLNAPPAPDSQPSIPQPPPHQRQQLRQPSLPHRHSNPPPSMSSRIFPPPAGVQFSGSSSLSRCKSLRKFCLWSWAGAGLSAARFPPIVKRCSPRS